MFDPYYFAYCEDLDLSWRTWIFGYNVVYAPKSFIFHKIGQVMNKQSSRKKYYGERNLLRTVLKNYELSTLWNILPIYFGKRIGKTLEFLIHFDKLAIYNLYAYIKAITWNIVHMPSLIRKRKKIQKYRKRDDNFVFKLIDYNAKLEASLEINYSK